MNKILKLVQNELVKVYRQIGWRILTIFVLIIAAASPLLSYGVSLLGSGSTDYGEMAERETDSIWKVYYQTYDNADDFFAEKNIGERSWQYRKYYSDYLNACLSLKAMELVIADDRDMSNLADVMNVFYVDGMERVWEGDKETDKFTYREPIVNPDTGETSYGEAVDFTPELARRLRQKFTSEKTKLEKQVNTKFSVYINDKFKEYKKQYQTAQNELKTVEAMYQNNKSVITRYQIAKMKSEGFTAILQTQQQMTFLDSLSLKEQTDIINILTYLEDLVLHNISDYAAVSRDEFDSSGGRIYYRGCQYTDYDEYTAAVDRQINTYYQGLKQYCYALSHNISIARLDSASARRNLSEALSVNSMVAMFLAILLSASTVASEHTSGAIRLLMIRPRARWKILLSKLLCIVIYVLGLTAATSLISTLTEVLIYGGNDLGTPYLLVNGNIVSEIPPIFYYIYYNSVLILPWVFAACAALLLSVLTKRAVPSLAIPMLIAVFGSLISQLSYDAVGKAKWLKLTPVPYFNISDVFPEPMNIIHDWYSPQNFGLTLGGGIAVFSVYSLIMLVLAFALFNKQQIKN